MMYAPNKNSRDVVGRIREPCKNSISKGKAASRGPESKILHHFSEFLLSEFTIFIFVSDFKDFRDE